MTGRHHADLIDGGERFRFVLVDTTPAHFPGKHATAHDQAIAIANASIQELAKVARSITPLNLPPLPPRARRRQWWF